jgi:hypothetical protein
MTEKHLIIPPPELVQQWWEEADQYQDDPKTYFDYVATEAAQWGADQELEACCHCFARDLRESLALELRAARRPKPPSLKEQALDAHNRMMAGEETQDDWTIVRRALEQLDG